MAQLQTERYRIEGMDCAGCARKIDTAIRRLPGIADVSVSSTAGTMTVSYSSGRDLDAQVMERTRWLGYGIEHAEDAPAHKPAHTGKEQPWWRQKRNRLTIASGLALALAFVTGQLAPQFSTIIYALAMSIGLVPVAKRALTGAIAGSPFTIEMLMSIAAIGALIIGAAEEAAVVVFLFLVGELLEGVAAGRARASIRDLAKLVPDTAQREQSNGRTEAVAAEELARGDTIQVRPGDRIAADGEIISGNSSINEAPVTGESVPKNRTAGDHVYAGTVNGEGLLRVRVTNTAEDNTISRIIRLVEEAQERKAPTERFIDRFSRYYTPFILLLALLVAVLPPLVAGAGWSEWIYKGLAVLLIGCPCALVISTPAAIAASLSAGARRGLLLKGGAALEVAGSLDLIAFDKTGTLTQGRPVVTDVLSVGAPEAEIMRLAAALEQGSSHPLALAIMERFDTPDNLPAVDDSRAVSGKGVAGRVDGQDVFFGSRSAALSGGTSLPDDLAQKVEHLYEQGKTVSLLRRNDEILGAIAMRDEPRSDAAMGIALLRAAGIHPVMLTGDNTATAAAIAGALGMDFRAELLPQDKSRIVSELQREGRVGKVGDGINDAPALATADLGIAMGGGTDVALETADAAILHGRVGDVAALVDLSRKTMRNIWQNIAIALGLKVLFFATTILGITGLWPAILADTGATVFVTLNAMRLLAWRQTA